MWSEAVHQMCWLSGLLGCEGQSQLPPVFCSGPPSMSYKMIFRWLFLVLDLEVPKRDQAVNQVQLH